MSAQLNCACGGFVAAAAPACNGCGRTREQIQCGWERVAEADKALPPETWDGGLRIPQPDPPRDRWTRERAMLRLGFVVLAFSAGAWAVLPEFGVRPFVAALTVGVSLVVGALLARWLRWMAP